MKAGWLETTVGEACILRSGTTLPNEIEKSSGEIPYLKVADMNISENLTGVICSSRYVDKNDVSASNLFPIGTTIFPKRGGAIFTNKKLLTSLVICADLNIMGVTPKDGLLPKLLFYYFLRLNLREINSGSSIPQINNYNIEPLPISFPKSLSDQQRIVRILDAAFDGIATAKANAAKNLQNARALFESYLEAVFTQRGEGWDWVTLETLLERGWIESHLDGNHGGDYPRKEEFISEGVPYISANCLDDEQVDMSRAKYLSLTRAALIRKGIAKDGDVLFAHNATVGPVAILHTNEEKVILGTSLTYYRCNRAYILPEYLAHYMRSFDFKSQYLQVMGQSTRNQVPITKQREFFHVIPPLNEQKVIVGQLDSLLENVRRLESIYQRKLVALEALKKSLLHQAFNGEL